MSFLDTLSGLPPQRQVQISVSISCKIVFVIGMEMNRCTHLDNIKDFITVLFPKGVNCL